jgi:hypothetical protein
MAQVIGQSYFSRLLAAGSCLFAVGFTLLAVPCESASLAQFAPSAPTCAGQFEHELQSPIKTPVWIPKNTGIHFNHSPTSFRYIALGIRRVPGREKTASAKKLNIDPVQLFTNPAMIADVKAFSASAVSEARPNFFHPIGLLLDVPSYEIQAMSPTDMYSTLAGYTAEGMLKKQLSDLRSKYGVMSLEELLSLTHPKEHNEVIFASEQRSSRKVIAYFVVTKNGVPMCSRRNLSFLMEQASINRLPVVFIEGTSFHADLDLYSN